MKELNLQETIDDIKKNIDKLKENLLFVVNDDLNDFLDYRIKYYQNLVDWLEKYQEMLKTYENDLK